MNSSLRIAALLVAIGTWLPGCKVPDPDSDGDGFPLSQDCDDGNKAINRDANDICYDGIDQDCSGDDRVDCDADGFNGTSVGGQDCDDSSPLIYPGASDIPYDGIDQDCSGQDLIDQDKDGYAAMEAGGKDCRDDNNAIYPGSTESPYDGIDQDCDGSDLVDVDRDGFTAAIVGGPDCNDADDTIYPGAPEVFDDDIDQDCSGRDLLSDTDGDGYASTAAGGMDCDDADLKTYPGATEVANDSVDQNCDGVDLSDHDLDGSDASLDCDDLNAAAYPGATEIMGNSVDENCDGFISDQDNDGQLSPQDCDDLNAAISPDSVDLTCNSVDENCDGLFSDEDCDGILSLELGATDCDDARNEVHPQALEITNNIDDDCDSQIDEIQTTADASATFVGSAESTVGQALDLGDINDDGFQDLVMGVPGWRDPYGVSTGAVIILPGRQDGFASSTIADDALIIYGTSEGCGLGMSLAVGDVSGDGIDDIVVGAPDTLTESGIAGAVYMFAGGVLNWAPRGMVDDASFAMFGNSDGSAFGQSVAIPGDVDGDGIGDLLVGAPATSSEAGAFVGAAYLFVGREVQQSHGPDDASASLLGSESNGMLGTLVAGLGDINGDRHADVGITAPGSNGGVGQILVMIGGGNLSEWTSDGAKLSIQSETGGGLRSIAAGSDLNGDGRDDFLVGDPRPDTDERGRVYVLFGRDNWPSYMDISSWADGVFLGGQDGDRFGATLLSGNADADAYNDAFIAAPGTNAESGIVYLFSGRPGLSWGTLASTSASTFWKGASENQQITGAMSITSPDNSGLWTLAVGSIGDESGGEGAGAAFVYQWR